MARRFARGICGVCGKEYALRWCVAGICYTMRRHGWPETCEGSGCDPTEITQERR